MAARQVKTARLCVEQTSLPVFLLPCILSLFLGSRNGNTKISQSFQLRHAEVQVPVAEQNFWVWTLGSLILLQFKCAFYILQSTLSKRESPSVDRAQKLPGFLGSVQHYLSTVWAEFRSAVACAYTLETGRKNTGWLSSFWHVKHQPLPPSRILEVWNTIFLHTHPSTPIKTGV